MRLLNEHMIDSDADIGALTLPVHGERLEHLLTVIACAVSRQSAAKVAPWARKRTTLAALKREMKRG